MNLMQLDWKVKGIALMLGAVALVYVGLSESGFEIGGIIGAILAGLAFFAVGYFVYDYASHRRNHN